LSVSTSFRAFVIPTPGFASSSSRMTWIFRPATCQPFSSQNISQPLYMSFPAWAPAPLIGARNPILIGSWATASPAPIATMHAIARERTHRITRMLFLLATRSLKGWTRHEGRDPKRAGW
jgi:hypothetical protein